MNKFAMMVKEVASPDLGRMGMELLSFTIKDVSIVIDELSSLSTKIISFSNDFFQRENRKGELNIFLNLKYLKNPLF